MTEQNQSQNPYEPYEKYEKKKDRLKQLQKSRFTSYQGASLATGMDNMQISSPSQPNVGNANVPQDMYIASQGNSQYRDSNSDYSRFSTSGGSIDKNSVEKPKKMLNMPEVQRGEMYQYKTSSLEVPPSPGVPFMAVDEGQASPKLVRSTMYRIPANYSLHQSTKIPMGLVVQPIADVGEGEYDLPKAE